MERFTPQLATMMQGILKLHARRDAHAKRIGRYLVYQYHVRATQKTWAQPYRIETLLAGAGIEVDCGNPGRFRQRIESALATLANVVEMHDGPVCIASWTYPNPVATTGRGWFNQWLASGIVIMPPKALMAERDTEGSGDGPDAPVSSRTGNPKKRHQKCKFANDFGKPRARRRQGDDAGRLWLDSLEP